MTIFIEVVGGKTISLECCLNNTIDELKYMIYIKEGLPPCQQRLVYNRKQLDDGCKLSYYNLHYASTLRLVVRLR